MDTNIDILIDWMKRNPPIILTKEEIDLYFQDGTIPSALRPEWKDRLDELGRQLYELDKERI